MQWPRIQATLSHFHYTQLARPLSVHTQLSLYTTHPTTLRSTPLYTTVFPPPHHNISHGTKLTPQSSPTPESLTQGFPNPPKGDTMYNMTTDTPANPHGIHNAAAFHLIALAEQVTQAEDRVADALNYVMQNTNRARTQLELGANLNRLGELQGSVAALETAISSLEAAAAAFQSAVRYFPPATVFPTSDQPDTFQSWFDRMSAKSVRLQEILS